MSEQKTKPAIKAIGRDEKKALLDIAFSGVFYGLADASWVIFDYTERDMETKQISRIGKAFCDISVGRYKEASHILEGSVLKEDPDCEEAKLFMALIMKFTKRQLQLDYWTNMLKDSKDNILRDLADKLVRLSLKAEK